MITDAEHITEALKQDILRNREGKLSSRQWLALVTEPIVSLMLLSVPMILLVGRYGLMGRYIVLALVLGFGLMTVFRAVRFARVKLVYRVVYAEQIHPRWMFWRKLTLTTVGGDPMRFDYHVIQNLNLQQDQALLVYYVKVADRCILLSAIPQKHPQASLAHPIALFQRRGGRIISS